VPWEVDVIERLLKEILRGGTSTPAALARQLNTSPEMVTAMLERLVQLGLIETFSPSCDVSSCQDCSLGGYCQKPAQSPGQIWAVKGSQTL
jgi:hypothetical protein